MFQDIEEMVAEAEKEGLSEIMDLKAKNSRMKVTLVK